MKSLAACIDPGAVREGLCDRHVRISLRRGHVTTSSCREKCHRQQFVTTQVMSLPALLCAAQFDDRLSGICTTHGADAFTVRTKVKVMAVAAHPTQAFAAMAADRGRVLVVSLTEPGANPFISFHHDAQVNAVAFSPSGRLLASASNDATVALIPFIHGRIEFEPQHALKGQNGAVLAIAFSDDEKILASGDQRGGIFVWDVESRLKLCSIVDESSVPRLLVFTLDSQCLVAYCSDLCLHAMDLPSLQVTQKKPVSHRGVKAVLTDKRRQCLVTGSLDGDVCIWRSLTADRPDSTTSKTGHYPSAIILMHFKTLAVVFTARRLRSGSVRNRLLLVSSQAPLSS